MGEFVYVYILASGFKHLYIGVTSNLEHRIWQHKNYAFPNSFTAKYNINQLVHFERYRSITTAIAREKELKGWLRIKKVALIVSTNPTWKDLSADWVNPSNNATRSPFPGFFHAVILTLSAAKNPCIPPEHALPQKTKAPAPAEA